MSHIVKKHLITSSVAAVALLLGACGGGGGSGSSVAVSPPPPPVNQAPNANAGSDTSGPASTTITLNGSASNDPDGDQLTYSWSVSSQPSGANAMLGNASTTMPTFSSSVTGNYSITLTVTDPSGASDSDTVVVTLVEPIVASMSIFKLSAGFSDAEFDQVHQRVVTVFDSNMSIIESDGTESSIALPYPADAVSISPDGLFAGVAHLERVSYIDLSTKAVITTFNTPYDSAPEHAPFSDIILDDNGRAHLLPDAQNPQAISLNLSNGFMETNIGLPIGPSSVGKLHPNGRTIYTLEGRDANTSDTVVDRLVLKETRLHNFSNDGDFNAADAGLMNHICNDLWMGPENSVLTGCHNLVRLSDNAANDRKIIRRLGSNDSAIQHASYSAFSRKWFVLDMGTLNPSAELGSDKINAYDADTGKPLETIALPNSNKGADTDWIGKFVFSSNVSDSLHILAVNDADNPTSYALLVHSNDAPAITVGNQPPAAITERFVASEVGDDVILDASESFDPESAALSYAWTLISEPAGSSLSLTEQNSANLKFSPAVAGVYEFALRVSDGVRESPIAKASVNVHSGNEDMYYRLGEAITDAEFSKPLNALVYISDEDLELVIIDLSNFSKKRVPLQKPGYRVGLSPDGLFAAVSHDDLATLVDLTSATVTDTQVTKIHRGDIVLDRNYIAHISPLFLLFGDVEFEAQDTIYSIDFANDIIAQGGFAYKQTQLRIHPTLDVMYGAWTGISPGDIAKWDISTFPAVFIDDSRYHGDYDIQHDVWISEDGEKIVNRGGPVFEAKTEPANDMEYVTVLPEIRRIKGADQSAERNQWVATTENMSFKDGEIDLTIDREYFVFDDTNFSLVEKIDITGVPTSIGVVPAAGEQVFYSDDGSKIFLVLNAHGLVDNSVVQIINQD